MDAERAVTATPVAPGIHARRPAGAQQDDARW
jgi:hypothetical protein